MNRVKSLIPLLLFTSVLLGKDFKISGQLVDENQNSAPGVTVLLESKDGQEVQRTTSSKKRLGRGGGNFEFKKVSPGHYFIKADGDDLGKINYPIEVSNKNLKLGQIALQRDQAPPPQVDTESFEPPQDSDPLPADDEKSQDENLIVETTIPDTAKQELPLETISPNPQPDEPVKTEDTLKALPKIRPPQEGTELLPAGDLFFDMRDDIQHLQTQIDSLKKVIKVFEKSKSTPSLNEEILNLIRIPQLQHRIELENGSVVIGEILERNDLEIIVQTSIGALSIDMDKVEEISDVLPPKAQVDLVGSPRVDIYPDREEISGTVKNISKKRADFVRVVSNLWAADTDLVAKDSVFVKGSKKKYFTGIHSDTALEPGSTAKFKLIIPLPAGSEPVEYRTFEVFWEETK